MDAILGTLLRILEFIIAFGLLVFLHEFGHYLMAKLFNIEVEEFGFGFPPRLVKLFKFRETDFTLNWIPFGAFVRPKGENDPNVPGGLAAASPWARLAVLFGGPVMNLITGILLFSIIFSTSGAPDSSKVLIARVVSGSPAEASGLQANDVVQKVNGITVDSSVKLKSIVDQNLGQEITITVDRGGKPVDVRVVPRVKPPEGQGALGIEMGTPIRQVNWIQSLPMASRMAYEQGRQLITLPVMLLRGQVTPEQSRIVGPKGIYDIYTEARNLDKEGTQSPTTGEPPLGYYTLGFLATISIALGFTNLLPIPALDGGRILFVLPELLLRRRVPAEYENMIHLVGFAALILLMIYITTQDFINPITLP